MTARREALGLPLIFLTVAWLGGLRAGATIQLLPPPLISLVLGVMLVGTLVHSGVFSPHGVMGAHRTGLENVSGLVVLITLLAASAQIFNLLSPDRGIFHVAFNVCFLIQLSTTLAGVKGRRNLLRSLAVLLGSACVVRFVVLEGLYAPDGGFAKRLLTTLVEGASLGTIQYEPAGAITGYVAFLTLTLYIIGIVLLPPAPPRGRLTVRALHLPPSALSIALVVLALTCSACGGSKAAASKPVDESRAAQTARQSLRDDALRRARVWHQPAIPISQFDFAANPPAGFSPSDEVQCRFTVQKLSGLTPKFHCQVPDGRILKVKYGEQNAELQAEIAGTRLLRSLGFAADDVFNVRAVHCAGCPRFPFRSLQCHERIGLAVLCFGGPTDYGRIRTFTTAVIDRRMEGTVIEAVDDQGWSWYELDAIDPARGGSSRAEVDAFRLLAIVLAHWDNKGPNQRLLCPAGRELPDGRCAAPVAMIQDPGATFGPSRVDLPNWRRLPVWRDRATCTISMSTLPYAGATFPDRRISEEGRLLIAGLLEQLSVRQLEDLFTASRIIQYDEIDAEARSAGAWVKVFLDKVRQIREGDPCPQ
jgi:hypothetical protein